MPNHVTNRVVVSGPVEDVAAFKKLMVKDVPAGWSSFGPDGTPFIPAPIPGFDFNGIIPQPEILDYVSNPTRYGPNGRVMLFDHKDALTTDEGREATEAEQEEIWESMKHIQSDDVFIPGIMPGWYDWRLANWGTKWNAYDYAPVEDHARLEFTFDTAWSAPNPVYDKLAERFPTLGFDLAWFDEGWMHAGQGSLGHCATTGSSEGFYTEPTDELHERVYGVSPLQFDDEEDDKAFALKYALAGNLRMADNFTVYDVGSVIDPQGYFTMEGTVYSDDPMSAFHEYQLDLIRSYREHIMEALRRAE